MGIVYNNISYAILLALEKLKFVIEYKNYPQEAASGETVDRSTRASVTLKKLLPTIE